MTNGPKLDLNTYADKLFAPTYFKLRQARKRFIVVRGGAGSAKSYSVHQLLLIRLMLHDKGDILIIRKFGGDHRESTYKLFKSIIESWGIAGWFVFNKSADNRRITYKPNGCAFVFKGLDDPDKIKSITKIRHILCEEANQLEQSDFDQLTLRPRGFGDSQLFLILNPVSENHWIKTQLCDDGGAYTDDTEEYVFTYHDNPFLTYHDRQAIERTALVSENFHRVYALGEWGIDDKTNKFVWAFDKNKHVQPVEYKPGEVTWVTFDFNYNPMTCSVWHADEYQQYAHCIEDIRLPNSDTGALCDLLLVKYPNALWQVTGDASGANHNAIASDGIHHYTIIKAKLGLHNRDLYIPLANPPIKRNQLLMNFMFQNWDIKIDPKCSNMIYDLTYCETNNTGDLVKDRTKDTRNADFLDGARYLFNIVGANAMNGISSV